MSHEKYADWDGAYVMGSLSRAERQEFEEHLTACGTCRDAVADLGALPGLLGRLTSEDAIPLMSPVEDPPSSITTPPVRRAGRRARVRIALAAAAAVVAAAVAVPLAIHGRDRPTETVALHRVAASPLSADAALTTTDWGTRVEMTCSYAGGYGGPHRYVLDAVDTSGHLRRVSSWHAGPGDTVHTTGSTDLRVGAIRSLQVRDPSGRVLLSARM